MSSGSFPRNQKHPNRLCMPFSSGNKNWAGVDGDDRLVHLRRRVMRIPLVQNRPLVENRSLVPIDKGI